MTTARDNCHSTVIDLVSSTFIPPPPHAVWNRFLGEAVKRKGRK